MEKIPLTFDQLPSSVYELGCKVDTIIALLSNRKEAEQPAPDEWLSVDQLRNYLPGRPAIATIYAKVQKREIPFRKTGKRLTFLKSEIDAWLNSRKGWTFDEVKADALAHTAQPAKAGRKSDTTTQKVERTGGRSK